MTDREIILESRIAELERRNAELVEALENIDGTICYNCNLYTGTECGMEERHQPCTARETLQSAIRAGNVADNYLVPALSQEVDNLKARNAELVEALKTIDGEICSFCTGELCFKLCVENQPGIYRMCKRREILQSAIRAGNVA